MKHIPDKVNPLNQILVFVWSNPSMHTIQVLYLMTGGVFAAAFVPQIISLIRDKTGAASVSLVTWGIFSFCSIVTLVYAAQINQDLNFIITAALGTVGNLTVFCMAAYRRLGKHALENGVHMLGVIRKIK